MFRVAIVGHSQVPARLSEEVENTEIRIYRKPGARARNFEKEEKLNSVLEWKHDLTVVWLGSNDIDPDTRTRELTDQILAVGKQIEQNCDSKVVLVEIENRVYQSRKEVIANDRYKKIKRAVNVALMKSKQFFCINFNSLKFTLGRDGVHFEPESKKQVQQKLIRSIKSQREEWVEARTERERERKGE